MAIYRLFQNSGFGPEDIERMTAAYEKALVRLGRKDRADSVTERLARRIIEVAHTGARDPDLICALALKHMTIPAHQAEHHV